MTGFKPGDKVYGCIGGFLGHVGAMAEFVKSSSDLLVRMPYNANFGQAGALPFVGMGYHAIGKELFNQDKRYYYMVVLEVLDI